MIANSNMKQKTWILKTLNIRKEEASPVFLMMLFSFFVGLSLSCYFTASNAIFLKHFPPKMIPVSFIASGIIVCLAWWIFTLIDKRSSFSQQVIFKFIFVFISVLAISTGVWMYDTAWLAFILYTWVRVMVYITLVNFWGLAGKLFNIRQGKRIFGLISIGEVISTIIGYFSIPLMLQFLKTPDLLFLSSFSLFICLIIVLIIFKTFSEQLQGIQLPAAKSAAKIRSEWNYLNLIKKPYFLLISMMALLPIFGYLFVDFLFLSQTKGEFDNNPETIARFFGIFLGFVAIVELIFKLVSGRFLDKYGLKPSLISLPLILAFSILLAALFGSLYGPTGLFFAFLALARLFERSVRGAVYEPAFQLLYQPVPNEQRLTFQNQIEGIPKALGTVVTGVVILILSSFSVFNLVYFNYFFLAVLGLWIWLSVKMYSEYRNLLKVKISEIQHELINPSTTEVALIERSLLASSSDNIHHLVEVFEKIAPAAIDQAMENAYAAAPQSIKSDIAEKIQQKRKEIKEAEDFSFDFLVQLSRSGDPHTRENAARLAGYSGRYNTYKILIQLLKDPVPNVKKAAIISAGKIKRYELWSILIENLVSPEYGSVSCMALKMIGAPILAELDQYFDKIADHKIGQLRIIRIYESVGGEKAVKLLRNKISYPDKDVRYQVMLSLSNLEYHASVSESPFITQTIEESVEIMVWIMANLLDTEGYTENMVLQNALLQELEEKKENIFLLLSLLYDTRTIRHIRETIESQDVKARVYALEICDMTFSDEIKVMFLPLFEDIPLQERLHRFRFRFPQEKLTRYDRLHEIINKDFTKINRWTKACAIYHLGLLQKRDGTSDESVLAAHLVNPDVVLGELAAWMLFCHNEQYYLSTIRRFEKKEDPRIQKIVEKIKERQKTPGILLFETILRLKESPLFAPVPEIELVPLAIAIGPGDEKIVPEEVLFEFMTGNLLLAERYLNLRSLNVVK